MSKFPLLSDLRTQKTLGAPSSSLRYDYFRFSLFAPRPDTVEQLESISYGPPSQNVGFSWYQEPLSIPNRDISPLRPRSSQGSFGTSGGQIKSQGWLSGHLRDGEIFPGNCRKSSFSSFTPRQSAPAGPHGMNQTGTIPGLFWSPAGPKRGELHCGYCTYHMGNLQCSKVLFSRCYL